MKKFEELIEKRWKLVSLAFLLLIFVNTCGNPNKVTNRRVQDLTNQLDSLKKVVATKKDLQIEGLKAEKRMIQATDRTMMDVQRQSQIDAEISSLEKNNQR